VWLDGGHNPAGGQMIAQTFADLEEKSPKPLLMIVGMIGSKDARGYLTPFRGLAKRVVAVPVPGGREPPQPPSALADLARSLDFEADAANGVEGALLRVQADAKGPVRVLICGSLYLAGHVLALEQGVAVQAN
jgi:dihydrofolate synthase / folylpolyglutamate synthase